MKLIQKTSRAYLILSSVAFLISVVMLYLVLKIVINSWLDEKLLYSKKEVVGNIKFKYPITTSEYKNLGKIEDLKYYKDTLIFKDTAVYRAIIKEFDVFRQLTSYETIRGEHYKVVTRNSLVNNDDFINVIIVYTIVIFSLLLTGLLILNTQITKNIWNPFYANLNALKNFSIQNKNRINLIPSKINEFNELNDSIKNLTNKVQSDFNNLKEFTENASHEMQTPLAIMQSKIELLLQTTNLSKNQAVQLQSIYQAGKRLSKLNTALLLLAKVENQQYNVNEKINLKSIIENQLENYEDFIINKNLTVNKNLISIILMSNKVLIDTLIVNLLSNAIKHNIKNGIINITHNNKMLIFSNTGKPPTQNLENLFNRFKKDSVSKDSIGLGLSIVKKICVVNNWNISYTYKEGIHKIEILF
ncbi:MAG: HAMP domain-containing histidine kinase [Flavobacteriaceae bacterium]|nr:HAMP domain-containing histidine kinase [Flavobacteriaceae bacterium]